jgi:hypothetical protein
VADGRIDDVRWDALFDDLAAQGTALEQAELAAEVAERTRGETGRIGLVDRTRAAVGLELQILVRGAPALTGRLARAGADWLLLDEPDRRETLIASAQVVSVRGLGRAAAVPGSAGVVESRIGFRQVLRAVARDRSRVRIHLADGSVRAATIDRVGADFVDVAIQLPAAPRRSAELCGSELLVIAAISAVRRSV